MEFQPDYLIAWDFKEPDFPCVTITRLRADGKLVIADVVEKFYSECGVCSLRQVLERYEVVNGRTDR